MTTANHSHSPGFGLSLRPDHFDDVIGTSPAQTGVDWFEVPTEDYLNPNRPQNVVLERVREDYPITLHGVAMSLGSPQGPTPAYLCALKQLIDRVQPLWISDHLCWTGAHGHHPHDLLPLPYNAESVATVVRNVRRVQDYLQRPLLLENVSTWLSYKASSLREWEFVSVVAEEADCLILLDVNNIHVSSVNHGFDAQTYLRAMPVQRVQQIHLAGHSVRQSCVFDTHDQPVADTVWSLYADALRRFGPVATSIERDHQIPPLAELSAELLRARQLCSAAQAEQINAANAAQPTPSPR